MQRVLLLYSTVDGQTKRIAERIRDRLLTQEHLVQMQPIERAQLDITEFDKVVIGASIRYGKYRPQLFDFIANNQVPLRQIPSAFFSVNLVARKPNKNTPSTNPYVAKFLRNTVWQPKLLGVFAGKINYPIYRGLDKHIIRFIMWLTKGPTDANAVVEYTDWGKVELFADQLAALNSPD